MRKSINIITTLFLTIAMMLSMFSFSFAQSNSNRVIDDANLLTDAEEQALEAKLAAWCDQNSFDIVIVTNYNGYSQDSSGQELVKFADDFYDYNGYGYGNGYDGCILVIDMGSREFYIGTTGYGITALTDYGIEKIKSDMTEELSDGDYYEAIDEKFVGDVQWMFKQAVDGEPYDYVEPTMKDPSVLGGMGGMALIFGSIISFIKTKMKRGQLKSVRRKTEAQNYVRNGSLNLTRQYDRFLYSNVVANPKPKDDDNNHRGGSTIHTSSSGRSHGGGGGHF